MAISVFSMYVEPDGKVELDYPVGVGARLTVTAVDDEECAQGYDLSPSELRVLAKQFLIAAREIEHAP